jgi:hypothetical protein
MCAEKDSLATPFSEKRSSNVGYFQSARVPFPRTMEAISPSFGSCLMLPPSEYPRARSSAGARKIIASVLIGALLTVLCAVPALAGMEFAQLSVKKGVLLVASP